MSAPRVACLGECMIELSRRADGNTTVGFGGDTLNTAVYLARLGIATDYVTALGDDPESDAMVAAWNREGVGTTHVARLPGRVPGLYMILTDANGERRFLYWRDQAPARELFLLPGADALMAALEGYDLLYLSGISLAIWGAEGRAKLLPLLDRLRARGGLVAFDTNWRPRLWAGKEAAAEAYEAMFSRTDILLAGSTELDEIFGWGEEQAVMDQLAARKVPEIVLKLEPPAARLRVEGEETLVPARKVPKVVDTTAAGDSFAAGYLAARLVGKAPPASAEAAHRLASLVVQHRGAIIPKEVTAGITA
ncbi:sugar kinase [Acetobacteraceae bacterium H6797]|nr:sugar kinase [Acetobacteraceae bacterium H6797]